MISDSGLDSSERNEMKKEVTADQRDFVLMENLISTLMNPRNRKIEEQRRLCRTKLERRE